jgi:effector-binding domain-containing protein
MKLSEEPEIVIWPSTHYVYVERIGPFMETAPQAWQSLHSLVPVLAEQNQITGYLSLYKMTNPPLYRAGVSVADGATILPEGSSYEKFKGGKYSRFVLTGLYSNLPQASRRVMEIVSQKGIAVRDDYFIEHYVTDPSTTPAEELITEILVPTV